MSGADIAFPHIGVYISSLSKGITIGGFTIAFYGIIIACGMLAGLLLVKYLAKKSGQSPELYMDFAIWAIIFSLLGARLYYVAFSWDYYKDHLTEIFNTRGGGMAIFGGVIVAVITAIVFCKKRKYSFALFADTAVPGLLWQFCKPGGIWRVHGLFLCDEAESESGKSGQHHGRHEVAYDYRRWDSVHTGSSHIFL